jgi:hypothetical protein
VYGDREFRGFTTIQHAREEADRNSCCTLQFIPRKYRRQSNEAETGGKSRFRAGFSSVAKVAEPPTDRFGTWTSSIPNIISALRSAVGILRFVWNGFYFKLLSIHLPQSFFVRVGVNRVVSWFCKINE